MSLQASWPLGTPQQHAKQRGDFTGEEEGLATSDVLSLKCSESAQSKGDIPPALRLCCFHSFHWDRLPEELLGEAPPCSRLGSAPGA